MAKNSFVVEVTFKDRIEPSDPLYPNHKILKLQNIITLNNCQLITYQMLLQIISNFLKISTGITQGVPISSP